MALRRGFKTWCENAARGYRRELGLSRFDPLPPRLLANFLGILVWIPSEIPDLEPSVLQHLTVKDADSWDAVTIQFAGQKLVVLNDTPDVGRQNNSLAHEASHIILRHEPAHIFVSNDGHLIMNEYNRLHEDEANCLAGTILVPREALLNVVRQGMSDQQAAAHFGVSLSLLRMRRNTTGINKQLAHTHR